MNDKKILFVTDFDGTLTKFDTTPLSVKACKRYSSESAKDCGEIKQMWEQRSATYLSGYLKTYEESLEKYGNPKNNQDGLYKFMETLDKYNTDSRIAIAKTGFFYDISEFNIKELVNEIEFYDQALEVLSSLNKDIGNVDCRILSVNWFKPLLVEALKQVEVRSNQIVASHTPKLIGDEIDLGPVSSSVGKQDWIIKWCKEESYDATVYIGDSLTDLLALIEVDYGIIFGKQVKMFQVAERFGISYKPLIDADVESDHKNVLYFTENWSEILKFIKSF